MHNSLIIIQRLSYI